MKARPATRQQQTLLRGAPEFKILCGSHECKKVRGAGFQKIIFYVLVLSLGGTWFFVSSVSFGLMSGAGKLGFRPWCTLAFHAVGRPSVPPLGAPAI